MKYPKPHNGLVICYRYLWDAEAKKGKTEGLKDRPCALVLTRQDVDGETTVTVCPITHRKPSNLEEAIEIPLPTKKRLGLDSAQSWVIVGEVNQFVWPGYDLQPIPNSDQCVFGALPPKLFKQIRLRLGDIARKESIHLVDRND